MILIKYKPTYTVSISGEKVGYINNKEAFEENIKNNILETNEKNVDSVAFSTNPEYTLGLVDRNQEADSEEIIENVKGNLEITYKYYEIALSNVTVNSVNTIQEAESLVGEIKKEENSEDFDLSIIEKHTNNVEEVKTNNLEIAKENVLSEVSKKIVEEQQAREEQERIDAMPVVNGIKIATIPVNGTITSRYGDSSSMRRSTHTGIDIACATGTPIEVISEGTIISASNNGAYGNLVKVDHGNGVETWYAHTSKMYVSAGQKVSAGEIIAAVGSTGNSTGAHLHLEIRINGNTINPQKYLYN